MSDDLTIPLRRGPGPAGEPGPPLSLTAALGGVVASAVTLVLCLALALMGWFFADAGAHGDTTDALRVGADAWLVGHGSRIDLNGYPLGIVPLALTMMIALGAFRSGRSAGVRAGEIDEDRDLALGVAAFTGAYVVLVVLVCLVASTTDAEPGLGRSILGGAAVAVLAGGLGLAIGTGSTALWLERAPVWAREVVGGAVAGALLLFAAGGVLATVSLLMSFNEASNVLAALDLGTGDAITLLLVTVLLVPNAALLGSAYLIGPGFAVGTVAQGVSTSVSPVAPVVLGSVPAFPLLAALPDQGPTPGWLIGVCAAPLLCAGIGVALAGRDSVPLPLDLAALRGAASGLGAAVLITLAIGLAGGPMGVDRLADVGASLGETFLFAVPSMVIGGSAGALLQSWWQRRGLAPAAGPDVPDDPDDPDTEETVRLGPR